jgi:hypothetical protein
MRLIFILISALFFQPAFSQTGKRVVPDIERELSKAQQQYHTLKDKLDGQNSFPKTYSAETDKLETSTSRWWCSGFYPGSLLYLYEETKDTILYKEALRMLDILEKEQNNTSTHDLGFMMYCSFGNAYRLHPSESYEKILVQSAKSLCTRFDPKVGCIRSWNSAPEDFLVIIDNMMNLELLFWATEVTGDSTYCKIASTHADNTIKNHFRADGSSYHVVNYNPQTGEVKQKKTAQGFADESAWARGQSWGLYGYTLAYRFTKNEKYLQQAIAIADFILNNPNLPTDKIPYWDFNDPDIPAAKRDASAGAIACSALLELYKYVDKEKSVKYYDAALTMLQALSRDYQAKAGTNGGFILEHSVGHLKQNSEVDVPLSYADYYYIEALKRLKEIKK